MNTVPRIEYTCAYDGAVLEREPSSGFEEWRCTGCGRVYLPAPTLIAAGEGEYSATAIRRIVTKEG